MFAQNESQIVDDAIEVFVQIGAVDKDCSLTHHGWNLVTNVIKSLESFVFKIERSRQLLVDHVLVLRIIEQEIVDLLH